VFPTAAQCASWAGLCPGQNESAGVNKSARTKKGNRYLRCYLTQSAWAASHTKEGYLRALFYRIKASRGWSKAIVALAHKILVIAYEVLKNRTPFRDLGGDYFDKLNSGRIVRRITARLERLGYQVQLTPTTPVVTLPSNPATVAEPAPEPKRKRGRPGNR
jgi:transposase